jgi:hypothetical protein
MTPIEPTHWSLGDLISAAIMVAGLVLLGSCFTQL